MKIEGITFGPELTDKEKLGKKTLEQRGLSFVCYQSSLTDGFEFMWVSWLSYCTYVLTLFWFSPVSEVRLILIILFL